MLTFPAFPLSPKATTAACIIDEFYAGTVGRLPSSCDTLLGIAQSSFSIRHRTLLFCNCYQTMAHREDDSDAVLRADVDAAVARILARRDHARGELVDKLRRRNMPMELIDEVLNDYTERGVLDDARFASEQGAILARKCWGPRQIAAKLRARGVADAIIDDVLAELGGDKRWRKRATERLHSRFGESSELSDADQRRAYRHLTYRGYSPGLVRRLLFDD